MLNLEVAFDYAQLGLLLQGVNEGGYKSECMPEDRDQNAWNQYAQFHKKCLDEKDEACLSRAFIWRCGAGSFCGGLGDEVRGLASALYVAMSSTPPRPFFVEWNRMGQNMLNFFKSNDISVSSDALSEALGRKPTDCKSQSLVDAGSDALVAFSSAINADTGCHILTTNFVANQIFKDDSLKSSIPAEMEHIKPAYAVGCAMNFMFKPAVLTPEDKTHLAPLPGSFAVVHHRCDDGDIGSESPEKAEAMSQAVGNALKCAKEHQYGDILFLSASETAKQQARQLGAEDGLNVYTALGKAKHIEHDGAVSGEDQLRESVMSEWLAMQGASALFLAARQSGFSATAASMSFLPRDKYFDDKCKSDPVPYV